MWDSLSVYFHGLAATKLPDQIEYGMDRLHHQVYQQNHLKQELNANPKYLFSINVSSPVSVSWQAKIKCFNESESIQCKRPKIDKDESTHQE